MSRGPATGPAPDPDLFFFLSFAETSDTEDGLVDTFFRDLRDEVRAQAGIGRGGPAPTGFLSIASLRLGEDWSQGIRAALGTCAVFVALTSPVYFASPSCGKEWQAFVDRQAAHARRTGVAAPVLLPIRWRESAMHPVAFPIQYLDRQLSERVHRQGLLAVARDSRLRDDYHVFVLALASLIVRSAREHRLTTLLPGADFDHLPQAFPAGPPAPPPDRHRAVAAGQHEAESRGQGPPAPPKPRFDSDFPHLPGV